MESLMRVQITKFSKNEKKPCDRQSSYSPICILNDDCLRHIFNYLPVVDRIRLERVSNRWKEVGKESWSELKVLVIEPRYLGLRPFDHSHRYPEISKYYVTEILKRCGTYLKELVVPECLSFDCGSLIITYCKRMESIKLRVTSLRDLQELSENCEKFLEVKLFDFGDIVSFDDEDEHRDSQEAKKIMHNFFLKLKNLRNLYVAFSGENSECLTELPFPQMEDLRIYHPYLKSYKIIIEQAISRSTALKRFENNYVGEAILKALAKSCSQLSVINLNYEEDKINSNTKNSRDGINLDSLLSEVFYRNANLKSVTLESFKTLTGKCFLDLNKNSVEKISLKHIGSLQTKYLIQSLPNLDKLRDLEFIILDETDSCDGIAKSVSLCNNLRKLSIIIKDYSEDNLKLSITSLKNQLEVLIINHMGPNVLSKSIFEHININFTSLKVLDLSYCDEVDDNKIFLLRNTSQLEELIMEDSENITGMWLNEFSNLKKLFIRHCDNLEDDHLIKLLKCAPKLEMLDISSCGKISNNALNVAIHETRKRKNNVVLSMIINETSIDVGRIDERSSLLHLICKVKNESFSDESSHSYMDRSSDSTVQSDSE